MPSALGEEGSFGSLLGVGVVLRSASEEYIGPPCRAYIRSILWLIDLEFWLIFLAPAVLPISLAPAIQVL